MLLKRLILSDVGTFSGYHEFDLTPRVLYKTTRPVILFGGLNGAGKTTLLTAVRLALYGKMATDSAISQKNYEEFLRELIHRPKLSLVKPESAFVELELVHSRLGEKSLYKIVRSWTARGKEGANEKLQIFKDQSRNAFLEDEQAQALLSQLIPPGISQLFFFDGEKIASLAKDDADAVLADSIRRLLGLDLAERLNSDLSVYLRQLRTKRVDSRSRAEIENLQSELDRFEAEIRSDMEHLEQVINPALDEAKEIYRRKHGELADRGGAWAVNRDAVVSELDALRLQRVELESVLRDLLSGIAILSLAPKLGKKVVAALEESQEYHEREVLANAVRCQLEELKCRVQALSRNINKQELAICIDGWADDLLKLPDRPAGKLVHGLVAAESRSIIDGFSKRAGLAASELLRTYKEADRIAEQESKLQERLATAPSDETIKDAVAALTEAAERVGSLSSERKAFIEELRRKTWLSVDLVRKLKKLEGQVVIEADAELGEKTAESLQAMIDEFKVAAARDKCESLRRHFIAAFVRLARKEDIIHDAIVSPHDFTVTLYDQAGHVVPKKRLSAGEKQIYAIAMLEALGKTSGRNLPVIIDTPLGRLDSKHRTNLVESYFPIASHQVIILSTDTEVDRKFYEGLQKQVSHAFHLSFNYAEGATVVESGYFWKYKEGHWHVA